MVVGREMVKWGGGGGGGEGNRNAVAQDEAKSSVKLCMLGITVSHVGSVDADVIPVPVSSSSCRPSWRFWHGGGRQEDHQGSVGMNMVKM